MGFAGSSTLMSSTLSRNSVQTCFNCSNNFESRFPFNSSIVSSSRTKCLIDRLFLARQSLSSADGVSNAAVFDMLDVDIQIGLLSALLAR